jgi:RNA polymerase sigma factor for flagellar operon FliA
VIRRDAEQRERLWQRFQRGRGKRARNELAETYLPVVRLVAEDVVARVPRCVDPDDLFSVGVFGLLQSIESFDPRRGVKFETWCKVRIRGAMIDELRSHDRLSRDARDRARAVTGTCGRLRQELGREPTHHELSQRMRLRPTEVERILARAAARNVLSLDLATGDLAHDDEPLLLSDDLVDGAADPPEAASRNDLIEQIAGTLAPAERDLLRMRYGDELTMVEIGRRMRLSESRVCQIHSRLLAKLHRRLAVDS